MPRVAYVDGRYLPLAQASVPVEDRGYQFADGVYEVIAFQDGRMIDAAPHLDRLDRSLRELAIRPPMSRAALLKVIAEMVRRNRLADGMLYIQVTRGVARRDHPFPPAAVPPMLVMTVRRLRLPSPETLEQGVAVVTMPDQRWARRDIKSIALLPNVLAKEAARRAGAYEAWLVDETGLVTEGSSTNAWIVTPEGELVTRALGPDILAGITRARLIGLAAEQGMRVVERAFTVAEAQRAREAFVSSATSWVLPVTAIDGRPVGNGAPGSVARALRAAYAEGIAG